MEQILTVWISSLVVSIIIEICNIISIVNDIYESKYKINIQKLKMINRQLNKKINLFFLFIPMINIIEVITQRLKYNDTKKRIIDILYVFEVVEKMSFIEEKIYMEKPTLLTIMGLGRIVNERIVNAKKIEVRTENDYGDIYYEFGEDFSDIKILKVTGNIKDKEIDIQIEMVKSAIYQVANNYVADYIKENHIEEQLSSDDHDKLEDIKSELFKYTMMEMMYNEQVKTKKKTRKK